MNDDDDLVTVQLRKDEYELFKHMIKREQAWNYFEGVVKSTWIFIAAGGVLTVWALADKIKGFF